jgi:hypothetical protein
MDKAAGLGLVFRDQVSIDVSQVAPPVTDSYREFAWGLYYRPPNLAAWAKEKNVDPGKLTGAVRAADPKVGVA